MTVHGNGLKELAMTRSNVSRVFHRSLVTPFPEASLAQGAYITDASGRQYLDASGGAAVSCLGHGHPQIIAAIKDQLDRMAFAHTSFFTSHPAEALADKLSHKAPGGAWRVYFVSGGSEANEAALKLARQIQVERGQPTRDHFISRQFSYHGNTLGALSVGGRLANLDLFGPILLPNVRKIMPCFAYRWKDEGEDDTEFGLRAARALELEILKLGPRRAIAFIAETVVGATLGCVPAVPGYFKEIRRICDEHGVLMILDEVMCGMGRCGTLFACQAEGIVPDIITIAKGIAAGYQPLGAMLVREELAEEIEKGSGAFVHGHTYVGHATACAAGLAVQEVFEDQDIVPRVARLGTKLRARLEGCFGDHPHVGNLRGRGLFQGLEIVATRASKEPFPAEYGIARRLKARAMENGLICYPFAGTVDGRRGDHVLLAPPFIIAEAQLDELCGKLSRSLDEAIAEARA
jgi:adenosylmethionine-8-amino-7-oxononanoate aminotransferase